MISWVVELKRDGSVDMITRDRKAFAYDLDDVDDAVRRIKRDRRYENGDSIVVVEPDGYRRKVRV